MDMLEFLERVGRPHVKAALKAALKNTANAETRSPLYIYFFAVGGGVMITSLSFRPGFNGLGVTMLESRTFTGTMEFNANVVWNDGGTQRTGWIYTLTGPFTPAPMFMPDYAIGQYYETWQTTLPYTPGTKPSGEGDNILMSRFATGPAQASGR